MKRIGIDARLISQTGVGAYTRNLLEELEKRVHNEHIYVFLKPEDFSSIAFKNKQFHKVKTPYHWHTFAEQIGFAALLYRMNLDLVHFTYFSYPIIYIKPFVITIHDLTPLLFKTGKASTHNNIVYTIKHSAYVLLMKCAITLSKHIYVPTTAVKKSIQKQYGHHLSKKISVTYEGIKKSLQHIKPKKSLNKKYSKPFFVYVGNFYPHKNVERLILAFKEIPDSHELILVGPDDHFAASIRNCIKEHNIKNVRMHTHATDEELAFFLSYAEALVLPSLSEGFGLPLLEASYFKLPIIASDIPVFQEITGGSYISFDPKDIYSIATAISTFIKKPDKKAYVTRQEIVSKFSFSTMAQQTYDVYKEILG